MSREIKFEYLFENIQEDGRSIVSQIWTLDELEQNEIVYDKTCLIARRQFTGLYDINHVDIKDGDYMLDGHSGNWGEVKYIKGAFVVEFDGEYQDLYDWTNECVIGNIYEWIPNPLDYVVKKCCDNCKYFDEDCCHMDVSNVYAENLIINSDTFYCSYHKLRLNNE